MSRKKFSFSYIHKTSFVLLFLFAFLNTKSQQIKAPIEQRQIAMTLLNLREGNPTHGLDWIREMQAEGVKTIIFTVRWDMVYVDASSEANWQPFDNQMKLISDLGMKAGIRVHLGRSRLKWDGFWDDTEIMTDFLGEPSIWSYAESHFSYASEKPIKKAVDFIKEVCERYEPYQKEGKVLFVNVSTTQDQEAGYYYQNRKFNEGTTTYPALYDFSEFSMLDLQRRMEEKYENVNTLNKYWITKYTKFSQAAPYISRLDPRISLIGKRGKDFYMARHHQLKDFMKTCGDAIKSVNPGYRICYDFGSLTDSNADLRGTFNATSLSEYCDILKHNDEDPAWSFDILAHNVDKPIYNEIYAYPHYSKQDMIDLTDWFFENGSSLVAYLVATDEQARRFKEVLFQTRRWYNEPIEPIVAEKQMDIYVSQLIDSFKTVEGRWQSLSKNGTVRVAVNLIEDVLEEERIEVLPYKSPEELAELYGYYTPDDDTNQGTGNNNNTGGNNGGINGNGEGVVVNPPPTDEETDTTNSQPYALRRFTPEPLIVLENFLTYLDNDIFQDEDGYISRIELVSGPTWVTLNPEGFYFTGKPPQLGEFEVRLRAFDNRGAWVEDSFTFEVIRPTIDFSLIEANYFDVPINIWTDITDNKVLYINEVPEFVNIIAECNVDSISMEFEMTGPFYKGNLEERLPFSIFGDGRGFYPPEGKYQLTATALKQDSIVTTNTISFTFLNSRDSDETTEWLTYPNPFVDVCNVKVPTGIKPENIQFEIVDLNGRVSGINSDQITLVLQTAYIDLRKNGLQQGAYFLKAILNDKVVHQSKIYKY